MKYLKVIIIYCLLIQCTSNSTSLSKNNTEASIAIEKLRTAPDSLLTKIRIENPDREYEVKKGEIIHDSIIIRNTGKMPLELKSIKSKCDCMALNFSSLNVIPLKDSILVRYKIETSNMDFGNNHRTITVIGNFFPYFKNVSINLKIN